MSNWKEAEVVCASFEEARKLGARVYEVKETGISIAFHTGCGTRNPDGTVTAKPDAVIYAKWDACCHYLELNHVDGEDEYLHICGVPHIDAVIERLQTVKRLAAEHFKANGEGWWEVDK